MFKKTLTTILATVTALAITALPVSAAEPGYVTVGDAAHGYVDVSADWWQDTVNVLHYADGSIQDTLSWNNPENNQSIVLRRENVPSNGLSEQESINNLNDWVASNWIKRPDEYQNFDMGDAGTIAGHIAFWASWTTPGQYMTDGVTTMNYKVFYFVDDNYIYNIEIQSWDPNADITPALQAVSTFHF